MLRYALRIFVIYAVLLQNSLYAGSVFKIGLPDASAAEFRDFGIDFGINYPYPSDPFRSTKEFFSKPFTFEVGRHKDADFPFVQPLKRCEWADISYSRPHLEENMYFNENWYKDKNRLKYHPLNIKFNLPKKPSNRLFLKIGFADKAPYFINGAALEVSVNGKKVETFQIPYNYDPEKNPYPCFSTLLMNPKEWGIPASKLVEIPANFFKDGENVISLKGIPGPKWSGEEWFVYDYMELSDDPKMPQVKNPLPAAAADAEAALDFDEIVFSMRGISNDAHWYGNFGYYPDARTGYTKENSPLSKLKYSFLSGMMAVNPKDGRSDSCVFPRKGGKLSVLNFKTGAVRTIISDPLGDVRNPSVHFDGGKIMYSYRKGGEDAFNIYECLTDGSNNSMHSLSDGKFDDIEPTYMPNGDIVFVSTRCERTVPCWMVDVGILYRWFSDENKVRPISANVDQDNSPWPASDGNLIYMKWEYVHKSQLNFHALWKKSPDATNDMVYFGNDIPGDLFIDPKEVEGIPNKFVFTYIRYHGDRDHRGRVAVINAPSNPGDYRAFRFVSGNLLSRYSEGKMPYNSYTSPFPIGKNYILAVSEGERIVLMDYCGRILKYRRLPQDFKRYDGTYIMELFPIRKRPRGKMLPDMADFDQKEATVVLVDASIGRHMGNIGHGKIKKLMVSEILPHMVHLYGGTEPLSLRGAFSYERYLGTVDVESDGSAHFKVPAGRALSFTSLDADGRAVKRMHSFTMFAPGTSISCIGCHEYRDMAPPRLANKLLALRRPPDSLKAIKGVEQGEVLDYVRDIQPILNKHCLSCHNWRDYKGKIDLSEGSACMMPISYFYLRTLRQLSDGYNRNGNLPVYDFGSGGSPLMSKVDGSHNGVKLSPEELNKLKVWLDTGATASQSCACWESGMLRYYYSNIPIRADENWEENKAMAGVISQNCASCHNGEKVLPNRVSGSDDEIPTWRWLWDYGKYSPRNRMSSHAVFNTMHPERSSILMAPLDKNAGGRAGEGGHVVVFKSRDDPRYKTILAAIKRAHDYISKENPRYTDKNYEPKGAYLGALKRRGIIKDGDNLKNFDPFEADKKYWNKVIGK